MFLDVFCYPEFESALRIAIFSVDHEILHLSSSCLFVRDVVPVWRDSPEHVVDPSRLHYVQRGLVATRAFEKSLATAIGPGRKWKISYKGHIQPCMLSLLLMKRRKRRRPGKRVYD